MPSSLLPSLAHAVSGSTGTAISTLATYPLDLVNTRIKVQRQLLSSSASTTPSSSAEKKTYGGVLDAFRKIYAHEGGAAAFFAGLQTDVAKSVVDSFLFFLFYTWFRARRLARPGAKRGGELGAAEELAVGAVAGACARLFTTPVANVVTRRQTASLVGEADGQADGDGSSSFWSVLGAIRRERGLRGLWAGYSASLVLTLNPSVTFFLQRALARRVAGADEPAGTPAVTFALAAVSKAVATAVTYPFQIARARVQVSGPKEEEEEEGGRKGGETIFGTLGRIRREEGAGALYDGLGGELVKAFFAHGVTMASKEAVHGLLLRLYLAILAYFRRHPKARARLGRTVVNLSDGLAAGKNAVVGERGRAMWRERRAAAKGIVANLLEEGHRRVQGK